MHRSAAVEQHLPGIVCSCQCLRSHRNCLQDVFEDESDVHIVMELCEGGSLTDMVNSGKLNQEPDIIRVVNAVLRFIAQVRLAPFHLVHTSVIVHMLELLHCWQEERVACHVKAAVSSTAKAAAFSFGSWHFCCKQPTLRINAHLQ